MGKGDRRNKVATVSQKPMPQLEVRPPVRHAGGRPSNADKAALNARCLVFGLVPSPGARRAMAAEWAGDDLGRVLMREMRSEDDVQALWRVWKGFLVSAQNYRTRVLSISRSVASTLPLAPDPMQADVSHSIDIRSTDEKDEDARASWARWSGYMLTLTGQEREILQAVEAGTSKPLWAKRSPTWEGIEAYAALAHLAEVADRKRNPLKRVDGRN